MDNDGDLDLLVDGGSSIIGPPSDKAVLVRNNRAADFSSSVSFPARISGVVLGDVNGDGYLDLVTATPDAGRQHARRADSISQRGPRAPFLAKPMCW